MCVCVWVSDRSGCSCCWDFSDPGVKCRTRDEIRQQRERKSKDLMHGNGESTWNHYLSRQQGCYSGWVYSIFVYGCLCLRTVLNVPCIYHWSLSVFYNENVDSCCPQKTSRQHCRNIVDPCWILWKPREDIKKQFPCYGEITNYLSHGHYITWQKLFCRAHNINFTGCTDDRSTVWLRQLRPR